MKDSILRRRDDSSHRLSNHRTPRTTTPVSSDLYATGLRRFPDISDVDRSNNNHSLYNAMQQKAEKYALLGMNHSARFYGDKAVAFSQSTEDILRQARLYSSIGQHRRALHLLQSVGLDANNIAAKLLAAQCLFHISEYDDCLAMLGEDGDGSPPDSAIGSSLSILSIEGEEKELSNEIQASLCVLRAKVYEKMENTTRAVLWYKRALRCDLYCIEAFAGICESGLMSREDALNFIREVTAESDNTPAELPRWISSFYRSSTDRMHPTPEDPQGASNTIDILAVCAKRKYDALDFTGCVETCRDILKSDPYAEESVLLLYLASLVELDERHELFVTAHNLVDREPRSGISWMAVGYYYFVCGKPEVARRFLQKATGLNSRLAPAWVAFGHAYGAQDESDQAMASYRTAARLFPGAQFPMLFMGMEYARQSSLGHASTLFQSALEACPSDPAPRHELGVIAYRMRDMTRAVAYFKAALSLWEASDGTRDVSSCSGRRAEAEEATLLNLGHCYRRLREFPRAKRCYERALGLRPRSPSTCTALGMSLHAMGDVEGAVSMYHRALRISPEDPNCSQLFERALRDKFLTRPSLGEDQITNVLQERMV